MIPADLLIKGSRLLIKEDDYHERPDIREKAIHIVGNREGFMSLMHCFFATVHELEDDLNITELEFVESKLGRDLIVEIEYGEQRLPMTSGCLVQRNSFYNWQLSETEISVVASMFHGFWYRSYEHLHFDPSNEEATHAVWCGVDHDV